MDAQASGCEKPVFRKKRNPPVFLTLFLKKKQVFVLFVKKNVKTPV